MSSTANSNFGVKDAEIVPKKENLKGVYLLALCFFILFFSVGACMSLMGSIFDQEDLKGLGQLCNFCIYIAFCVGQFFSKVMVSK